MSLSDAELSWLEEYADFLLDVADYNVADVGMVDAFVQSNKRRFGEAHPHVGATLNLAGAAYLFVGKPLTVKQTFKDCRRIADVALDEWVLQSLHLGALSGLVAVHLNTQDFDEASFFGEKLEEGLAAFADAPEELSWRINLLLAENFFLQGDYDRAYKLFFAAAVTLNKNASTSAHYSQLAYIQARIAVTQYLRKDFEDALKILDSVLAMRDELNLPTSPLFIACSNLIAALYLEMDDQRQTEIYLNHALASTQEFYGMTDPLSCESLNYIANHYIKANDWSRAFEFLQESISYIDKRLDAEQTLWVLDNLITITSLLENYDLQERYVELMTDVYSREFKGDFMSDRSLVEKGDQGAALKRQQSCEALVEKIKQGYDTKMHPQVEAALGTIEPRVWIDPILATCSEYAFRLLDEKSDAQPLQLSPAVSEERDELITLWSSLEAPSEPPYHKPVTEYIAQNKHAEAIALVSSFKELEEQQNGKRSPALVPLLETLSNLYGVKAGKGASRAYAIYAKLISASP